MANRPRQKCNYNTFFKPAPRWTAPRQGLWHRATKMSRESSMITYYKYFVTEEQKALFVTQEFDTLHTRFRWVSPWKNAAYQQLPSDQSTRPGSRLDQTGILSAEQQVATYGSWNAAFIDLLEAMSRSVQLSKQMMERQHRVPNEAHIHYCQCHPEFLSGLVVVTGGLFPL